MGGGGGAAAGARWGAAAVPLSEVAAEGGRGVGCRGAPAAAVGPHSIAVACRDWNLILNESLVMRSRVIITGWARSSLWELRWWQFISDNQRMINP